MSGPYCVTMANGNCGGVKTPPYKWGSRVLCRKRSCPFRRLSKKVCSPLGPLCEGAPPAGGGGENCAVARNILGYGKVLSLRPFGAPPSQREVFRQPGGRIYAARQCTANGRLWETRGPGMPGPYRAAAKKRTPTQTSRRIGAAESLSLTPSPQTPLLPPSRRSPPFLPYRRC